MQEITLGQFLRDLRQKKSMTTRELGENIGFSYSYLASVEKGRRKPSSEFLEKYIYSIADNNDELKEIKKSISNITNGNFYKQYSNTKIKKDNESMIAAFTNDNSINSMFSEDGGLITDKIYNFPINDISFHLSDKYNSKFFKKIQLTDSDRNYINNFIKNHLIEKYSAELTKVIFQKNEIEKNLKELLKEGKNEENKEKEKILVNENTLLTKEQLNIQNIIKELETTNHYF